MLYLTREYFLLYREDMPRKARIDAPGALHHVIVRGIARRRIFDDDQDRSNFLDRLGDILQATETGCYAWALLLNASTFNSLPVMVDHEFSIKKVICDGGLRMLQSEQL